MGMSAKMGPFTFGKQEQNIFLGKEFARHQDYSESTSVAIDEEIRRFITEAYDDARTILDEHREALEAIAAGLLEDEVLDGEEIYALIAEHSDVDVAAIRRYKKKGRQEVVETA